MQRVQRRDGLLLLLLRQDNHWLPSRWGRPQDCEDGCYGKLCCPSRVSWSWIWISLVGYEYVPLNIKMGKMILTRNCKFSYFKVGSPRFTWNTTSSSTSYARSPSDSSGWPPTTRCGRVTSISKRPRTPEGLSSWCKSASTEEPRSSWCVEIWMTSILCLPAPGMPIL